ncbi:MAG: hypothetical protein BWY75_03876 [bacterium ADurb.Bin425]|nr:MAG: hypothetical protein BWY75_03876 [bacterium ADurb.Bin425]
MVGAVAAFVQIALSEKVFTAFAIETFVGGLIDVPLFFQFGKEALHHFGMTLFGGSDEIVEGQAQVEPRFFEGLSDFIAKGYRGFARSQSRFLYF